MPAKKRFIGSGDVFLEFGENAITISIANPKPAAGKPMWRKKRDGVVGIFNCWNGQKIIVHKKLTLEMISTVNSALKSYTEAEICQAIRNYAEILKGSEYYFKYTWTLREFLKRGLEKFLDLEIAKKNFQRDRQFPFAKPQPQTASRYRE